MTLRIVTPRDEERRGRRSIGETDVAPDYYLARLVKLIPGEAIVIYPFLHSRAEGVVMQSAGLPAGGEFAAPDHWLLIGIAWLILVVVVLLRWQATRDGNGRAQWGAVAIAAVSFFLWVPVMQGSFGIFETLRIYSGVSPADAVKQFIPELLLVLWTMLIPAFYRPEC